MLAKAVNTASTPFPPLVLFKEVAMVDTRPLLFSKTGDRWNGASFDLVKRANQRLREKLLINLNYSQLTIEDNKASHAINDRLVTDCSGFD